MDRMLNVLAEIISTNQWIAPLIAIISGILTSFSPCSLSTIPLIIGYLSGYEQENVKKTLKIAIIFSLGIAITFTMLGLVAVILGKYIRLIGSFWYLILGIIMILMALQIYEIFTFIKPINFINSNSKKGYIGAFIMGILGGLFSSPCSTPVLIVLLAMVANTASIYRGILLLMCYAIGNSFFTILLGISTSLVMKIKKNTKYENIYKISRNLLGTIILMIGLYMMYLGF